jgi:hypothetical protein
MGTAGYFSRDKAAKAMKLTTHFHLMPRSRMMELYLHYPIRLHPKKAFAVGS